MNKKNILSQYDLFATIVVTIVGSAVFTYPRRLSEVIGTDGWFVIILSGLISLPFIYLTCQAIKVNEYRRLTEALERNFGKVLGAAIGLYIVLTGIFIISLEMRTFAEVIKMYLLNRTPTEFIILVMFLVGGFLVRGELESVIKFNEIAFWLMFIPILLSIPFVLKGADFTNVFPILTHEPLEYIKATRVSLFSFLGFSILYMLIPMAKHKKDVVRVTFRSVAFITGFYIVITLSALFVFSKEYNSQLLWPTITMLSTVDIPGTFIERWEGIVMTFWIIFYFTTYVNLYYFSSEIIRDVFHLEDVKVSLVLITPIIYILSLYPENIAEVYSIQNKFIPYIEPIIIGILPIALLITGFSKARRVKDEA
ncbi:endospore germination permease [Clostridium bovifaecis]|uniref:Endospore germination permease n=1 Tax=Clostridium bovifaecis TaxID=2184719 RepID=A0A6I6EYP6_9CLOT|nr:endospore germination permease [Clostridium bovifaecis]